MGGVIQESQAALVEHWLRAFETARSALSMAGPYLGPHEVGERSRRLAEERNEIAFLLRDLGGK
jgi:hypothetical protein